MRKQYNIVAALSLFCSINASAQFSASYPNHDGSYVSSTFFNQYPDLFNTLVEKPKAAELFKFPEPDISYATGKINLQIPIYTMDLQLLTLPLTLQYNSSGIRIQDKPGVAGYGWNFTNMKITREINSKDDLKYPVYPDDIKNLEHIKDENERYFEQAALSATGSSPKLKDGQYDIFTIDLPHINANFILHYENGRYEPRFLKEQPLHIELLITYNQSKNSLHGIRVTDDNGVQYLFGTDKPVENSSSIKWLLNRITLPSGAKVDFTYIDHKEYQNFRPMYHTVTNYTGFTIANHFISNKYDLHLLRGDYDSAFDEKYDLPQNKAVIEKIKQDNKGYDTYISKEPIRESLLSTIETIDCKIVIQYNETPDTFISDDGIPVSYIRRTFKNIEVFSKTSNTQESLEKIEFDITDDFLNSIQSRKGTFKFQYDRRDKNFTTEEFEKAIDWWGYCNGKMNDSSLPFDYTLSDHSERRQPDSLYTQIRSLKKIIYPTGGYMKINYGTHEFEKPDPTDMSYGAGLRINSLEIYDPLSAKKITKHFRYESPRYISRKTLSSHVPYIPISSADFITYSETALSAGKDVTYYYPPSYQGIVKQGVHAFDVIIESATYFTFPNTKDFHVSIPVYYKKVTEYTEFGKTEYTFDYEPYTMSPQIYSGIQDNSSIYTCPQLLTQREYKKDNNGYALIKSVENRYQSNIESLPGVEIGISGRYVSTVAGKEKIGSWTDQSASLFVQSKSLGKGYSHLISTTIKEYFDGDSIETKKEFTYDPERPYNIISEKTTPKNEEIIKNMYYSNNVLPENNGAEGKNELPDNCYKTAVIQQTISRNNTTISSTLNLYTQVKTNLYRPYKQYVLNKDNIMEKKTECLLFDTFGNPIYTITDKENQSVYIWSYRGRYMIAKIENADYNTVFAALRIAIPILSVKTEPSESDWSAINKLRTTPSLKNARITTYKYKPLTGVTEITDSKGVSTYYSYDDHGRLSEIYTLENGEKKLLQDMEYKYYNE